MKSSHVIHTDTKLAYAVLGCGIYSATKQGRNFFKLHSLGKQFNHNYPTRHENIMETGFVHYFR